MEHLSRVAQLPRYQMSTRLTSNTGYGQAPASAQQGGDNGGQGGGGGKNM